MNKIILTNIPSNISPTWRANVKVVQGAEDSFTTDPHIQKRKRIDELKLVWRLLVQRKNVDCYVTTGDLVGQVFAFLQSIIPLGKKPHIMISAIWVYPRNKFELLLRRLFLKIALRSVYRIYVNTTFEEKSYSSLFKVPESIFQFLPYCYRLTGYEYEIEDNGYIWAGGNGDRDYKTLIEAVRGMDVKLLINSTRTSLFEDVDIPDNVIIQGVTPDEFREAMAKCHFGVIPMEGGKLHPGGQQTFLALMKMCKPVVLMDPLGGGDYIKDNYNGFIIPFQDVNELKRVISYLNNNPERVKEIGANASQNVLSEDEYMSSVLKNAHEAIENS